MSSRAPSDVVLRRASQLTGTHRVPGDKSISHRAAMLGAFASGTTRIEGYAVNGDCLSTLACVAALGASVERSDSTVTIASPGRGGLVAPLDPLDAGNSGTTMRLLAGLLAGCDLDVTLAGDESLSARPMRRVANPLTSMGARVETTGGHAPIRVRGRSSLTAISYQPDPPSAQVKSAVLLAGLAADGVTRVRERVATRDHTERLLTAFGVETGRDDDVSWVRGPASLSPADITIPGDVSSAAFLFALALLVPGSDITVAGIGLNPTRTRLFDVLADLGAEISLTEFVDAAEPYGDVRVRHTERLGPPDGEMYIVSADVVAEMIDEVPILAALATRTTGGIRFEGVGELRAKESDRVAAMEEGLSRLGASVRTTDDTMEVDGSQSLRGARVRSWGDHRIAMALGCLGVSIDGETNIEDAGAAAVSFPSFFDALPDGAVAWSAHAGNER